MWAKIKAAYLRVRQWCKDSEVILIARAQAIAGLAVAAAAAADWSPLFGATGMSTKQTFWLGAGLFAKGLLDEVARRYRAKDL